MVLVGQVGRDLVGLINSHSTLRLGCPGRMVGCSSPSDGARWSMAKELILAWSGMWSQCAPKPSQGLISSGSVPVVASIAPDPDGVVHNVNADTAAAALAVALKAERLVVLTDVEGLYRDWPNNSEVITELSAPSCAS